MVNAAKPEHSTDPVSAVTYNGKTLLKVKHGIIYLVFGKLGLKQPLIFTGLAKHG